MDTLEECQRKEYPGNNHGDESKRTGGRNWNDRDEWRRKIKLWVQKHL